MCQRAYYGVGVNQRIIIYKGVIVYLYTGVQQHAITNAPAVLHYYVV